jgi:hypothetical protein
LDVVGDTGLSSSRLIGRPGFGKIELEVDRDVLSLGRDAEADCDLAVRDLAGGPVY